MNLAKLDNSRVYIVTSDIRPPRFLTWLEHENLPNEKVLIVRNSYSIIAFYCSYEKSFLEIAVLIEDCNKSWHKLTYDDCSCLPNFMGYTGI